MPKNNMQDLLFLIIKHYQLFEVSKYLNSDAIIRYKYIDYKSPILL